MTKRLWCCIMLLLLLVLPLTGCYLVSGERTQEATPNPQGVGTLEVRFVTSDGQMDREIMLGVPKAPVLVDMVVRAEGGELTLSFLDPEFNPLLTVTGGYGLEGRGSAEIQTDERGRLLVRITANEARDGAYTIRYQLQVLPTPTPTVTPTPEPTP